MVRDVEEASESHFGESGVIVAGAADSDGWILAGEKIGAEAGGDFDGEVNAAIEEGVAHGGVVDSIDGVGAISGKVDEVVTVGEVSDERMSNSLVGIMIDEVEVGLDGFEGDGGLGGLETKGAKNDQNSAIKQNGPFVTIQDAKEGFKDGHIAPF